ncbi:MAG TPA: alpha/beta fold hydrolase [Candidatus Nanopelagicales bacterium]|nr:alpha/beta fold hydrolase [Candidatus Nanopelagicales bacterium]
MLTSSTRQGLPTEARWVSAWACAQLLVGLVAVSVGAGLAGRRLLLGGVTVVAVLELAVLCGGLLLVARSSHRLWTRVRGRRRLWFLPGAAVALVMMWSLMIAVMATVVPPTPLDRAALGSATAGYTEVHPVTDDGVILSAWWAPSSNGAAVVLLHGSGENRSAALPAAAVLRRHGYGVLLLDARGHGESAGSGMDLGWYGDSDVRAAVAFLLDDRTVDDSRIGALGLSMGAEEAIGAAGTQRALRSVVAEGATSRTAEDKAAWLPRNPAGAVQRLIDRVTYALVDLLTTAGPPTTLRDAVAGAPGTHFLLITAGTSRDEQSAAAAIRAAAPDRVAVWAVEGAAHVGGLAASPDEWETTVLTFFDTTLS